MPNTDLIRFVTSRRHDPYGHRTGVVAAAYEVLRRDGLVDATRLEVRALLDWIESNLAIRPGSPHHAIPGPRRLAFPG